jgi:putative glutamine amidotransferase
MLIGITSDSETVTDTRGCPAPRYFSPAPYAEAVARAGGVPVLLPHVDPQHAMEVLAPLHGLVIAGGSLDVPPAYYNETPRPGLGRTCEERSSFERALYWAALARDLPILGVCGGMQLINVLHGGSLYQDLAERPGTLNHVQPYDRRQPHHVVSVLPESRLARVCDSTQLEVNSTHHQVLNRLGTGVIAVGHSLEGVVEAIEVLDRRFVLGVQWHPEALEGTAHLAIYESLVEAARNRTAART